MYDSPETIGRMLALVMFASSFGALFIAHMIADYWLQTQEQANRKGRRDWLGRLACARHVLGHTVCNVIALAGVYALAGTWPPNWAALTSAVAVIAITHYWADRRFTLEALARVVGRAVNGKHGFYKFGTDPHDGHAACMGTGAAHLDQAWHILWLGVGAAIIAATV